MAYETEHALINGASNDTASAANLLTSGVTVIGSLASSSDTDYYKINAASAGLIQLTFSNSLLTSTNYWNVALLDSNGDYLSTLASSVTGAPVVSGSSNTGTSLAVTGLTSSSVPSGTRFTLSTSDADTTIYTVLNTVTVSGGAATLTLDKSLPGTAPVDGTALVFDPAQALADGGNTTLTGQVNAAGAYFVKVSKSSWTDAEYNLTANFVATVESSGANNSKTEAASSNNRLVANAWMSGNLSASNDKDVWLLTTAQASDLYLDFAATTGDNSAPQWNVTIAEWAGDSPVTTAGSVAISGSAGASKTFQPNTSTPSIDDGKYTSANTFVITVEKLSGATLNTGTYTLRARGTGLDLNDAPVITVDTINSSKPNEVVDSGVIRSIAQGADSKVQLNSLFSVADADSGQTISSYKVALFAKDGSSTSSSIKIEPSGGTATTYANGDSMTAAQMANAWLYAGTDLEDLTLTVQAFDSSGAPDSSGASSFMTQTIRVSSSNVGVTVVDDGNLVLVEKAISDDAGYSESFTVKLNTLPTADVKIYIEQATPQQFTLGSGLLTFTASNGTAEQTVSVRARDDNTTEGAHTGQITFRVVSTDSAYDGLTLSPLVISLSDPVNHAASGVPSIAGTVTEDQILSAATSGITDADGLGNFSYEWQRSNTGSSAWTAIANATQSSYTLGDSDVGKYLRLKASFTDGIGTLESTYSLATTAVQNINDIPTTSHVTVTTNEDTVYTFKLADFAFSDNDSADSLKAVELQELPVLGTLKYNGSAIALSSGVYSVLKADIAQLTYTPLAQGNGAAYTTVNFKVLDQADARSAAKTITVAVTAVDDAYSGSLGITGSAIVGRVLQASDTVIDPDGIPASGAGAKAYQWLADASAISGATSATYTLTEAQLGKTITLNLTYTDSGGTVNTLTSNATAIVAAAGNSAPTGVPAIDDTTPAEDQLLTATQGDLADADGLGALSYQWQRSSNASTGWGDIPSATSATYTPGDSDVGKFLRVVASYTDGEGQAESVISAVTSAVANINDAPVYVATSLVNQSAAIGSAFSYTFPNSSFTDVDPGATLTYRATLSDGSPLPLWLTFQSSTRNFSGTPELGDSADLTVKVTASDSTLASAYGEFALLVNTAPTLADITAASYIDTSTYDNFSNTSGTLLGSDPDADTLIYGISGGITGGSAQIGSVNYDISMEGLHGTLYVASTGNDSGKYVYVPSATAINALNANASDHFTVTVSDGVAMVTKDFAVNITAVADAGYTIHGTVRHWKSSGQTLSGVLVEEGATSDTTASDGLFTLSSVSDTDGDDDGLMTLAPSLSAPANKAESGVTLTDVLAALKVYLDKSLPLAYDSPYKYIAADFDGNGQLQLADVLQLLKYYLGKPTTNNVAPTWVFVDAADQTGEGLGTSFMGANGNVLSKGNTTPHMIDHNFTINDAIELVGVLRGDMDGSWTPPSV